MKTEKQRKILIEELEKNGLITYACKKAGIARSTYYKWIGKSKEFAKAAEKALDKGVFLINDVAKAQIILMIKDGNLTAIKFWLTHRDSAFSEKLQLMKHSEVNDRKLDNRKLTPEESELLEKAIERDFVRFVKVRVFTINKPLTYSIANHN